MLTLEGALLSVGALKQCENSAFCMFCGLK